MKLACVFFNRISNSDSSLAKTRSPVIPQQRGFSVTHSNHQPYIEGTSEPFLISGRTQSADSALLTPGWALFQLENQSPAIRERRGEKVSMHPQGTPVQSLP